MGSFYIDKTLGNDNNVGSFHYPWQTLTKANVVGFQQGDNLFLKRGEIWTNENLIIYTDNFTVDAYGDAEDKPTIRPCLEYLNDSNWGLYSGVIYARGSMPEPCEGDDFGGALFEDGLRMTWVDPAGAAPTAGQFTWVSGVIYLVASDESNPTTNDKTYRLCPVYDDYIRDNNGAAFEDGLGGYLNTRSYGSNVGILRLANYSTIKNIKTEYHGHYSIGPEYKGALHTDGLIIENCECYYAYHDLITFGGCRDVVVRDCIAGYCLDFAIVGASLNSTHDSGDYLIEGCEAYGSGMGYYLEGSPDGSIVFKNNKTHDNNQGFSFQSYTGSGFAYCDNVVFENNEVYENNTGILLSSLWQDCGDNTTIRYNHIHDNVEEGIASAATGEGIGDGTKIYGNYIHSNGGYGGIYLGESGVGLDIFSNIVCDHLIASQSGIFIGGTSQSVGVYNNTLYDNDNGITVLTAGYNGHKLKNNLITNIPAGDPLQGGLILNDYSEIAELSNNCYYNCVNYSNGSLVTISELQAVGFEYGSTLSDPLLDDSVLGVPYDLLSGSPCTAAGITIIDITDQAFLDYWGNLFDEEAVNIGASQEVPGAVAEVAATPAVTKNQIINGKYSKFTAVLRNVRPQNSKFSVNDLTFLVRPLDI